MSLWLILFFKATLNNRLMAEWVQCQTLEVEAQYLSFKQATYY